MSDPRRQPVAAAPGGELPLPPCSYVLPLRWNEPGPIDELAAYVSELDARGCEVIVVDGSPAREFERHAHALRGCRHIRPHTDLDWPMGKVNGVVTGIREASHERIVIGDDDVRYDGPALRRGVGTLDQADLVRPQNFFPSPMPWHARWDTARSLLNRVFTGDPEFPVGDFPGTLIVRRSALPDDGGYDGTALFENLELMRTVSARGGRVETPLDLYVARQPPSTRHFRSQRVRQAYDDFAIPLRMAAFLAILPLTGLAFATGRGRFLAAGAGALIGAAELGRRRAGGRRRFPVSCSLLAPAWVAERAVCAWAATLLRLSGRGVGYTSGRLVHSASSTRELRAKLATTSAPPPARRGPVAAGPPS